MPPRVLAVWAKTLLGKLILGGGHGDLFGKAKSHRQPWIKNTKIKGLSVVKKFTCQVTFLINFVFVRTE